MFQYSVENKRALFALQLDVLFLLFVSFFFCLFFLSKVCAKKCIHVSNKVDDVTRLTAKLKFQGMAKQINNFERT